MTITEEQFNKLPEQLKQYFSKGGAKISDGCIRSNAETAAKFGTNSCSIKKNTHPTPCQANFAYAILS